MSTSVTSSFTTATATATTAAAAAATTATTASASSSSSSAVSNKCFNSYCTDLKSRKGWRLRSGDFAQLCDRCASAYEEGRFCETFHLNTSGWRGCESCGKRVHCGCIVSIQAFTLLDAGGIVCMACARRNFVLTSNPAWPPLFPHTSYPERLKDLSVKSWSQLAGSGPVPWRQAPSLFNSSAHQSELYPRMLYEADRLHTGERFSVSSLDKRKLEDFSERLRNGSLKILARDVETGNAGTNDAEQPPQPSSLREDTSTQQFGMTIPYTSVNESNSQIESSVNSLRPIPPPPFATHFQGSLHNGVDLSFDGQIRNVKPRVDARSRSQLLHRYWPRFTDEELQQMSGNSNSVIKPLFEKMLSASDAGRIGRLVLPKKCAEAYFPPISNPEGLPLKVQDSKGKEWIFQFRFWPNNNSRMYVLEGVTPCIQSMQLQAGDIVTFSRLEPEGKLVMGFRKALPSDQDNETRQTSTGVSTNVDVELADPNPWSTVDKSGYIAKEVLEAKSSVKKRKSSTLGSKSKRLRIENEDMIELKLTWEEAQGLLRPPPDHVPSIVVIEGFEFEEYEDAPVLGKPTVFATDNGGQKIQWVQCEDCLKWRKLPANALLPSKWTCSCNSLDPERSSCSVAQELTAEQLEDLLPSCNLVATSKKSKAAKQDTNNVEASEGLDTLANLAILGEDEALPTSSQATTKHPRHRPGCSCIVCIQPPSGKGPKHKQTCTCNVCLTVKRRFKTLMMRRVKKQSEKEAETGQKQQQEPATEKLLDDDPGPSSNTGSHSGSPNKKRAVSEGSDDDPNRMKTCASLFKGQIDLNIQPEREDELSPCSDSSGVTRMLQDATERYLRMQRLLSSDGDSNSAANRTVSGGGIGENVVNGIMTDSNHQDADKDCPAAFSMKASASSTATG